MKYILNSLFVLFCFAGVAQEDDWRDSLNVAREAYKNEEYGKALKYYESAQRKAPENIDLSDEMAQSAYKARSFEKAEKIYQQGGTNKSSSSAKGDNFHNVGNARMKQRNYQGAIEAYKNALRANPNSEETRYNLSEAIRSLKDQQEKKQNKDENEGDQGDKGDEKQQDGQGGEGQDGQDGQKDPNGQKNGDQSQSGKNGQKSQNSQGGGKGKGTPKEGGGTLPNQMVERELDKLAKKEAETKQKMSGSAGAGKSARSGKDW